MMSLEKKLWDSKEMGHQEMKNEQGLVGAVISKSD